MRRMKHNFFYAFIVAMMLSIVSPAQNTPTYRKLNGYAFSILSGNGKYAIQNEESGKKTIIYNTTDEIMQEFDGVICNSATPEGIFVGQSEFTFPAVAIDGHWEKLPYPDDPDVISGTAWDITDDGTMICGAITYKNIDDNPYAIGTIRKPCIWERQEDGTYKVSLLKFPLLDPTHLQVQAVDAIVCSNSYIGGRVIDWSGYRNYCIAWKKDKDGIWQYNELGLDIIYKEGVKIPTSRPVQPITVDAAKYFTAEDSVKYLEDIEKYENGEISKNPIYYKQYYITDIDSMAAYSEAVHEYQEILADYNKKLKLYSDSLDSALTGDGFDVFTITKAQNGIRMMLTYQWKKDERDRDSSPAYFNLENGRFTSYKELYGLPTGLTMNDAMFYAAPVESPMRTTNVYDIRSNKEETFHEWIKEQTNGIIDIEPEYDSCEKDTTLMGSIRSSDNGNILLGFYINADRKRYSYIINLGKDNVKTDAPKDLTLEHGYSTLNLYWKDPAGVRELGYSTKEIKDGEGIGDEGKPFIGAIQFTPKDLSECVGEYLNSLTFYSNRKYNGEDRVETKLSLVVFENNKMVVNQPIEHFTENAWNTVALDEPLIIKENTSLQVGIKVVQHDINEHPLGVCLYSEDSGKSDLFTEDDGKTWDRLFTNGFMRRWHIFANIAADKTAEKDLGIEGYKLYFNGELYVDDMIKTQNVSIDIPEDEYGSFVVTAMYKNGIESENSNDAYWELSGIGTVESETGSWGRVDNGILYLNKPFKTVAIYSVSGTLVSSCSGRTEVNLSNVPEGVYVVVLTGENGKEVYKIKI